MNLLNITLFISILSLSVNILCIQLSSKIFAREDAKTCKPEHHATIHIISNSLKNAKENYVLILFKL